ncbi:MAG: hypothetical protein ACO3JG_01330 [Luteolibacter sp.]
MIPLYRQSPNEEMEQGVRPRCDVPMSIPCVSVVDTLQKLRSLLDGSLNTSTCDGCGERVTAQEPVLVNLEAQGVKHMIFIPLSYLEEGIFPAEELANPEEIGRTFFSLDELARQVRARIIVHKLRLGV